MTNRIVARPRRFGLLTGSVLLLALGTVWSQNPAGVDEMEVVDDFSQARAWRLITDRSLGGRSSGQVAREQQAGGPTLHLRGRVVPGKQGGFLQARLSLLEAGVPRNASRHEGVRLRVRGAGTGYAVLLRTSACRRTWQFYGAFVETNEAWQVVDLPFSRFQAVGLRVPLDVTSLRSVAVAALGQSESVDLSIREIGFYGTRAMWNKLTPQEERVIVNKGTEPPFSGRFNEHFEAGTYTCRRCGAALYRSTDKFKSHCGWPSFDDEIPGAVRRQVDADGRRTEIVCAQCGGHLGHVFAGEGYTPKNTRHCVNSLSLDFVSAASQGRAYFAGGCFWGVEHLLQQLPGVVSVTSGYMGGRVENPSYKQVCTGTTGHVETVEVVYDPNRVSYETLAKRFFEIHDFTQRNGQGPDLGPQYHSVLFYQGPAQQATAEALVQRLKDLGYDVATRLTPAGAFWPAEAYHQDYYLKTGKTPYCHAYRKIFDD